MEAKETLKRKRYLQTRLDALERREAFLEGKREHLLTEMREVEEEDARNLFTTTYTSPAIARSIFKDRSSFQDSGNLNLLFSIVFKMFQNVSKCFKMLQNVPDCSRLF